jgi:competence ComEA-like helix-hairpin-helix protein
MRALVSAFLVAMACGFLFALTWPVFAQSVLPDGAGKDVTVKVCGQCHAAEIVASVRRTPDGWRETIAAMVQVGATATDQELQAILEYVSTHFKGEAGRPLDLNTATAVELESVAGLLRKEAAALIAHREKKGPCKMLEDLRNVPGVDYKKLEARKDRLACR